ncbi:hypothetical protein D9K79_10735 [Acinetobacter cumulans]|uniref:Uncharacterized protein n=1 Tax=Acinetobacter cumulans TaxID=2136182 RepID=A0A498CUK2_9GAMM|nr:hypothetical protein [Acinetobacter cumulans]RLL33922.1 hypothetical protein D9K80_11960 [Acinetobacter cumulans]RLL43555.1 hypothetical protein D9K79_10735 [Acinetobacter cumulans]
MRIRNKYPNLEFYLLLVVVWMLVGRLTLFVFAHTNTTFTQTIMRSYAQANVFDSICILFALAILPMVIIGIGIQLKEYYERKKLTQSHMDQH